MSSREAIPPDAFLAAFPDPIRQLADELRAIVRAAVPDVLERVRPGWHLVGFDVPTGPRRTAYFGYVAPERLHVHLGFEHGHLMRDPGGILLDGNGQARQVRWLTWFPGDRIDAAVVSPLVIEAVRVARLGQDVRRALASGALREA